MDVVDEFIVQGLVIDKTFLIKTQTNVNIFKSQDLLRIAIDRKSVEMIQLLKKYNFDFQSSVHKVSSHTKSVYLTMCENGFASGIKKLDDILFGKYDKQIHTALTTNEALSWLDSSKFAPSFVST